MTVIVVSLCLALCFLALSVKEQGKYEDAIERLKEGLEIYRSLEPDHELDAARGDQ